MTNQLKTSNIPVASHGKHKHSINAARVFTSNFFEYIPIMAREYQKGDRQNYVYSFFNRLESLPVPALVTGQTKIMGFYVPFRSIFKGYQDMRERVSHNFSNGYSATISTGRYFNMGLMSKAFVTDTNLMTAGSSSGYDVVFMDNNNVLSYYNFTTFGSQVYKVLCSLGYPLSWYEGDSWNPNCHFLLAYLRVMYDHFFPLQYVGNSFSQSIMELFNDDTLNGLHVDESTLLNAIGHLMFGYFDSSWIESCWDKPVGPNVGNLGNITISDQSNNATGGQQGVSNYNSGLPNPPSQYRPSNGTPYVGSNVVTGPSSTYGVLTQFVIDSLQAVNNFCRRHGLSGNRLIENYLTNHGVSLPDQDYAMSKKIDDYSVPFEIDAVENNAEVSPNTLGELAGRGETSGKDFRFKHTFDCSGVFIAIQVAIPDSEPLLAVDPYNMCIDALDFQNATYEKLGVEAVPSRVIFQDQSGVHNNTINSQIWGFIKRYYYGNVDVSLEFGDFRIISRGSQTLNQYHTFRQLYPYISANNYNVAHSYDFLRVGADFSQFDRIFYTSKVDKMKIVGRWKGYRWTETLPYGDSFDWDDDEMNKKVTVLNSGNDSSKS